MTDVQKLIRKLYAAFNARETDAVFAMMTDDVQWPKASEGGNVIGKDAIRDYWTRQWSEFDPRVEPVNIHHDPDGSVRVHVHQMVKNLRGDVLFDGEVVHFYTLRDELVSAMKLGDAEAASSAFVHRH